MRRVCVCIVAGWLMAPATPGLAGQDVARSDRRLADLVAALEGANPELDAARREIEMRASRVKPAGAPPDPVISAGFMGGFTEVPFFPPSSNPAAWREFAVSQDLPYPGKLSLRSRIAAVDTEVARLAADDLRLERVAELKTMYMDYRLGDRSLAIIRRNRVRLQQMTRVTEARFSVGQGAQPDVVKAQLELTLLTERETAIERQQAVLRARLNQLLNRLPQDPLDPALVFDPQPLADDVAALIRLAEARYPALLRDEQIVERSRQALALARKEVLPDFGTRLRVQKYAAGMPWMYGVDVMANVPIFANRKQRQMVAEAASAVEVNRSLRQATFIAAARRIGDQVAMVTSTRRLIRLYEDSVLPQARLALDASLAAYETGRVDFLTLLTTFTTILDYELALEEQQAALYRALAALEPLMGQVLLQ